jgi:predicted amidohydrolase
VKRDRKIKVAVVQLNVDDGDKEARVAHAEQQIVKARGAKLILLPELWNVGYFAFDQYEKQSELLEGDTIQRIQKKAIDLNAYIMGGSIVEKRNGMLFNTSVLIGPNGELLGDYQKIHLFGVDSDEMHLLVAGNKSGTTKTNLGTLGLSICYDMRFPELYREMRNQGCEMFLVASAWPHVRIEDWKSLTRARAIENKTFLAAANCSGISRGRQFCGHSVILDPEGEVLAEAGVGEEVIMAEVHL